MNPANVLVTPERTGDAVQSEQDFLGGPGVLLQQGFQVAGRLMQVQDQCMENSSHCQAALITTAWANAGGRSAAVALANRPANRSGERRWGRQWAAGG